MMMMMSLPKMKISSLQPQLHLSSSRLLAATQALPSSTTRCKTSSLIQCRSAIRRSKLTTKSIKNLEKTHPLDLDKKQLKRYALVSGVSIGLMMALVLGMDAEKAMALGPEGPLMEEFWDNVRRWKLLYRLPSCLIHGWYQRVRL
ncbi:unnamed protein product [Eruca vesicaria subsp. sativa]|uniref:Uncharacterized protein n=1 Tax=Eruca vesicaria subsp. sativa TaxID=29727 RepID=A0ABC8J9U9_ERUVS|nr:unnamed protein product [Eruca vesicaria subsp. sativa]